MSQVMCQIHLPKYDFGGLKSKLDHLSIETLAVNLEIPKK